MYGCELWDLNRNYVKDFKVAWRKIKRRIWKLPQWDTQLNCTQSTSYLDVQIDTRMIKFIQPCLNHCNIVCKPTVLSKCLLLSVCFTCMFTHSCMPSSMIKPLIVPLVKNKCGNLADKNNYRPIALSSIASKVFEHVILCRLEKYLWTNDNQFGFKPSHSTDLCVYALTEFIEYVKCRSTSIYVAFLDASKAFGKISHWTLFKKIIDRGVPIYLVKILCYWYQHQELIVQWGSCLQNASAHGGLAYYIHSNWNYKVKSDTVDSPYWEEMYIEIYDSTNLKCKFTVGNMYRPPHTATVQLTSFIDYFTDRLSLLNVRETTVVCGDFNINLLSINSNEHYNTFFADTLSSSFLPTITLPTRLSNNSSLIDNIFVNKHERLNFAGILNNEISDHQVIAVNMNLTLPPQKINYITVFSNSDQSKINFKNDFESKSVYDRLNHELDANPDENYSILETAISDSMNAHLEKKIVKFNGSKHKKDPWITYGILNSVNHKNRLYKRLLKINRDTPLFMTKKTRVQCLQKFSQENNQSCKKLLFFDTIPKK